MRIFCLSTGRCGSRTFSVAMGHSTNFSSAHESRSHHLGSARLDYSDWHCESDNRLAWFLGGMQQRYGDDAVYVHLRRSPDAVALSYMKRRKQLSVRERIKQLGSKNLPPSPYILDAFGSGVLINERRRTEAEWLHVARMYVDTVIENIEAFLADKTKVIRIWLEDPETMFELLWDVAGVQGDIRSAVEEWSVRHNAAS